MTLRDMDIKVNALNMALVIVVGGGGGGWCNQEHFTEKKLMGPSIKRWSAF